MLNDLKDWAVEKGQESQELAKGIGTEIQTKGVMDWSWVVWVAIAVGILFFIIGIADLKK